MLGEPVKRRFASLSDGAGEGRGIMPNPAAFLAPEKTTAALELLERFPDERHCGRLIFDLRGGRTKPCPRCGSRTRWEQTSAVRIFQSKCCSFALDALAGTFLTQAPLGARLWLYLIVTFLNRSTPLSSAFVAAHLGTDTRRSWQALAHLRQHVAATNEKLFDPAEFRQCYVDEFLYRPVCVPGGGARTGIWLLGLSGARSIHVEPLRDRMAGAYPTILERLGVSAAEFYSCNLPLVARMKRQGVASIAACELSMASRGQRLISSQARLKAFWPNFRRSMRRGSLVPARQHMRRFVQDYVFRFNHTGAHDAMLRHLLQSLDPL